MAHQGFDPQFGLRGTSLAHVSGWGGWPLGVAVGVDDRPTMICGALDQTPQDHRTNRFTHPPVSTVRILSVSRNGQPSSPEAVFGPDADGVDTFFPHRAIVREDRMAVLGSVRRPGGSSPTVLVFSAGPLTAGVASWALEAQVELDGPQGISPSNWGLGWANAKGDVLVLAPHGSRGSGAFGLTLFLVNPVNDSGPVEVEIPYPGALDIPPALKVQLAVGAVLAGPNDGLLVGLTWQGQTVHKPRPGVFEQERASVLRLRSKPNGRRRTYEADPRFATSGLWIARAMDGEITTADQGAIVTAAAHGRGVLLAGRAQRAGIRSFFTVLLDAVTGAVRAHGYPATGLFERPTGIAVAPDNRIMICGSTAEVNLNAASDTSEAVVVCLAPDCTLASDFGENGIARFRLHGGTHALAVTVSRWGNVLVASAVGWGRAASAPVFHACLSSLSGTGLLDATFGLAGRARHDGIGEAQIAACGPAGQVWSAGRAVVSVGWLLTVSQITADGELASGFGNQGIATFPLSGMLPANERFFDVTSLVPLADGRTVVAGYYYALVQAGTVIDPEVSEDWRGTWILRMTASGALDQTFGTTGLITIPSRPGMTIMSELADGSLQGFEWFPAPPGNITIDEVRVGVGLLRLTPDGAAAPGWGATGTKSLPAGTNLYTLPRQFEPSGEWFALVPGPLVNITSQSIGLVRWGPNGSIDTGFGAGNPNMQASCFVDIAGTGRYGAVPGTHWPTSETLRLTDGTYLTIWSLRWQVDVSVIGLPHPKAAHPLAMLLIAWDNQGMPRPVPNWPLAPPYGGKAVRAIGNPTAQLVSWLGWRPRCSVLQPDGSVLVALEGDELELLPRIPDDEKVRQMSYFCRLVPPNFDLDPGFGNHHGVAYGRFAGEEEQYPVGLSLANPQRAVAAILLLQKWSFGTVRRAPDLPFDGSIGFARLS